MFSKKYRKKPVVIDAFQWKGTGDPAKWPEWLAAVEPTFVAEDSRLVLPTPEGRITASWGDYIIRGVAGEVYPCKPDIFERTYEEVSDEHEH